MFQLKRVLKFILSNFKPVVNLGNDVAEENRKIFLFFGGEFAEDEVDVGEFADTIRIGVFWCGFGEVGAGAKRIVGADAKAREIFGAKMRDGGF